MTVCVIFENGRVGREPDKSPVSLFRLNSLSVADKFSTLKLNLFFYLITIRYDGKIGRQRIDRLDTDSVQTDGLLECLGAKLTAGMKRRDGFRQITLRNAASVVTYRYMPFVDRKIDPGAGFHTELID